MSVMKVFGYSSMYFWLPSGLFKRNFSKLKIGVPIFFCAAFLAVLAQQCAASVTKLNLLKERGNSSPYFKSPKPSKESLHFHFPFFLFTMTIQTTSFFNEFHLVSKQPKNNNVKMYFCPLCNLKCILNLIFSPLFE